jgi:aquaporin related protein
MGTFLFLFIAYLAAQVAIGNDENAAAGRPLSAATLFYIAVGFGGGVLVALLVFAGISGEMFNPAVSIREPSIRPSSPH